MAGRQRNLGILRDLTKEFRKTTATRAVQAGQAIIEDGWRDRVAVRSGQYRDSIRSTPVRRNRSFVGGGVVATSGHALYNEFGTNDTPADPSMRDTLDQDGPQAERTMISVLKKGIR